MASESKDEAKGCGLAVIALLLTVPISMLRGWVLAKLWAWFVVPAFGVPAITWVLAIGLTLVATTTVSGGKYDGKKQEPIGAERLINMTGFAIFFPLFMLGLGWFWKQWM